MSKSALLAAALLFGASIILADARPAAAQGPAGAGAAEAAQDSSHSLNPMHWIKKNSTNSTGALGSRIDVENKLTPILKGEGILPANSTLHQACGTFVDLAICLAALHATHDLRLNFVCVQASVTGVHTSADVSGCKDADGGKQQSLKQAIHLLKPDANAKQAAKAAEEDANSDLAKIGG